MWFDFWPEILRVLIIGSVSYVTLMLVLRVSGKRTLGQLNAFDFVVTVALGSTLATILLSSDVAFLEGFTALLLLAALQFLVARFSAHLYAGAGLGDLSSIAAVVLETNGTISVIPENKIGNGSALQGVLNRPAPNHP